MSKKKILHISHTDIESDSRILKEIKALANANFEVYGLGVHSDEGAAKTPINFKCFVHSINLRTRRLKYFPRILRHILSLSELVIKFLPRAIKIRPDFIHCHDTTVLPFAVLVKCITGGKLIYDAHELESDRNGMSKIEGLLTLLTEKISWPLINALIVVSPSIEKWYFKKIGVKPSAIILNSPQYKDGCSIKNNYLREFFNIPEDALIFIYVGILGKGRGLDLIMEAFSNIDISAHVVFLGYGEMAIKISDLTKIHKNFHYHPAVSHSEVVPIVRSADYGLCLVENISLSDYYCLPNKLFEYCFAKIPVLASKFPDIEKIVLDHKLGECCELTPIAIADAVKRIGQECRTFEFVNLKSLSWETQENKLVNLYQELS